ncbi:hypothetical protein [Dyadobacter psychrotolerans]|uniref:Uncharacterized protein n=1 Tax=Dyadobacter psychrotolerans TaxID=2541721 RepID=A0A4V6PFM6_9BACT|nr:hypothetical protein [Dyadobacter psychrotolerans]TDE09608.1 hypothetical protein E0F88_30440 [Dyadobacter psychrotolerans]
MKQVTLTSFKTNEILISELINNLGSISRSDPETYNENFMPFTSFLLESLELSQSETEISSICETIINVGLLLDDGKYAYIKGTAMNINRKCTSALIKDLGRLIQEGLKAAFNKDDNSIYQTEQEDELLGKIFCVLPDHDDYLDVAKLSNLGLIDLSMLSGLTNSNEINSRFLPRGEFVDHLRERLLCPQDQVSMLSEELFVSIKNNIRCASLKINYTNTIGRTITRKHSNSSNSGCTALVQKSGVAPDTIIERTASTE